MSREMHSEDGKRTLVTDSVLHQPIHDGNGEGPDGGAMPGSVLLNATACIDQRRNATTAYSRTSDSHSIQVAFWPTHLPLVSYFSVHCPDLVPADFASEPVIMATEDDLVLLRVVLGPRSAIFEPNRFEYFIYQAGRVPWLQLLKHLGPSRVFGEYDVGLLRCRSKTEDIDSKFPYCFDDDSDFYIIAALCYAMVPGHYDLHTFDSRTKDWETEMALLHEQQERGEHSAHVNSKVIVVGGEAGTMGWVDLWQGILLCDVLLEGPVVRYLTLPAPLNPDRKFQGCLMLAWDIAIVKGCIKYVEFQKHIVLGSVINGNYIANGWTVVTWSGGATIDPFEEDYWQQDCRVHASQISVTNNPKCFELLLRFFDDQGAPQPTLERLHTGHPTLSLHDDNVVYLISKIHYRDTKAWVFAVDVRNKVLQGAAEFGATRTLGMSFAYMCTGICKHLHIALGADTKGDLK